MSSSCRFYYIAFLLRCVVFRFYNIYYPGDFLLWRSTNPDETAQVPIVTCSGSQRFIAETNTGGKLALF